MNNHTIQSNSLLPLVPAPIDIWIGADWADQAHVLAICTRSGATRTCSLEQKPELLDQFFLGLRQEHPPKPDRCLYRANARRTHLRSDEVRLFGYLLHQPAQPGRFPQGL